MTIIDIGIILIAIGVAIVALGYNMTLGGYSRKKLLAGTSVHYQVLDRLRMGRIFMKAGVITIIVSWILIFVVFGLFIAVKVVEISPEKVDVMTAQNRTVIIADGKVHKFAKAYHHIKRVYFIQKFNMYGFECFDSADKLIIEHKDLWER